MATKKQVNKTVSKSENKLDVTKAKDSVKKAVEDVKEVAEVIADKVVDEVKEAVEDVKETADKVAEETKEVVKKAKKATTKKEIKTTLFVEYAGKQVEDKTIVASVKKDWTKANGKKVSDIKTMALYVKPEEAAVYYVINGTDAGKVEF